jgi:hypothetical protein
MLKGANRRFLWHEHLEPRIRLNSLRSKGHPVGDAACASIGEDPVGVKLDPPLLAIAASGLNASDLRRSEAALRQPGEAGPEMSQFSGSPSQFWHAGGNPP